MCMCETSTAFVCKFSSMVLIALIGRIQFKWIFIIFFSVCLAYWFSPSQGHICLSFQLNPRFECRLISLSLRC
jgi:hypothetical protein